MASILNSVSSGLKLLAKPKDATSLSLLVAAVVCAIIPLDISQLIFACAGAIGFSVVQILQNKARPAPTTSRKKSFPKSAYDPKAAYQPPRKPSGMAARASHGAGVHSSNQSRQTVRTTTLPEVRKPSNMPIVAPTLRGTDWDSQIKELLIQIAPTIDDDKIVAKLARRIEQAIQPMIPEVEVVGFASGSVGRNKAFGVAVPDVDIVAHVSPSVLMRSGSYRNSDARKLRKSAIRACTERLVSSGGFKFRRSAFRGEEPKVTLLAPASFGLSEDAIPIDFSVNAAVPMYNAALLTECGQMEPRARDLILMVKRWAKDRGICHAAKGHLSPYTWGLLTIFFLQLREKPLLPKLAEFKMASGLMDKSGSSTPGSWKPSADCDKSVGTLFKEFLNFYNSQFEWATEAVSIRSACRQKPGTKLPLHVIVHDDGKTSEVAPSIEDPFDESKNLAAGMNTTSLARLREEFARAADFSTRGASLVELLEPWAPPETPEQIEAVEDEI